LVAVVAVIGGGRAAEDAARAFANANNGIILGDTVAGRALAQSTAGIPWSQARPQWLSLSEDFARSASGEIKFSCGIQTSQESTSTS